MIECLYAVSHLAGYLSDQIPTTSTAEYFKYGGVCLFTGRQRKENDSVCSGRRVCTYHFQCLEVAIKGQSHCHLQRSCESVGGHKGSLRVLSDIGLAWRICNCRCYEWEEEVQRRRYVEARDSYITSNLERLSRVKCASEFPRQQGKSGGREMGTLEPAVGSWFVAFRIRVPG